MRILGCIFAFIIFTHSIFAQQTEIKYLSGTELGNEQEWKFYCTEGNNSKKWSKIAVPSQWELKGFGEYTYGRWYKRELKNPSMEQGFYEYSFSIPKTWKHKKISIIFEGVMTDTEVKINGQLAGEIHRGGFYEFTYDITNKLKIGDKNKLEVKVSKHSENMSVNAAERRADWWLFGGIYRPVYLEAKPQLHIQHAAINAQMDGTFTANIRTTPLPVGYSISASISPLKGNEQFKAHLSKLQSAVNTHLITANWKNVQTWTPETPNLYNLKLELLNEKNELVHCYSQRIGFRTVEFRRGDGIYVNNIKIVMKGTNRHSFHPDGGRTTNRGISLMDVKLLKDMNMNAVRSHYPPDNHFLDMCDSLGLFYIDELAGWQNPYDNSVGVKLVKEMIDRDVNHPCIVLWSNGNEGGWNTSLDGEFAKYDPQKRHVIHPWADFDDLDTHHYPAYQTGVGRFTNGSKVFMPTEFAHGLYDQGNGAGMEDFWNKYIESPLFAGGFTWAFSDEAVRRSDKNGLLDSDEFNAPDGILGPYREKEGSFYTIREVWSPIHIKTMHITPSFNGEIMVSNKYLYSKLGGCQLQYNLKLVGAPLTNSNKSTIIEVGSLNIPNIQPGETVKMNLPISKSFFAANVLELKAVDTSGNIVCNWTYPIQSTEEYLKKQLEKVTQNGLTSFQKYDSTAILKSENTTVQFNLGNGCITKITNNTGQISLTNGPIAVGIKTKMKSFKIRQEGNNAIITFFYHGGIDSIRWEMHTNGLLRMSATMLNRASSGTGLDDSFMTENISSFGLTFSYPESKVLGMEWYGKGPYRVWKNRIKGTNFGLWNKAYNNTITGESFNNLVYPEFKGYHANLYWAKLQTKESSFSIYSESNRVFFRVFTPEEPKLRQNGENSMPEFPEGDLSFLYEIPAIRDFKPIPHLGPESQPSSIRIKKGDEGIKMNLWFDFR